MRYLLIKRNGDVKEFERLPRSINPKDTLISLKTESVVNKVLSLTSTGLTQEKPTVDVKAYLKKVA